MAGRTAGAARTGYLLSGDQEVGEYNASGALLRRFLWGPAGPDEIVAVMEATGGVAVRLARSFGWGLPNLAPRSAGQIALDVANEARPAIVMGPSGAIANRLGTNRSSSGSPDTAPDSGSGLCIGRAALGSLK
jgi:hypothetical protein